MCAGLCVCAVAVGSGGRRRGGGGGGGGREAGLVQQFINILQRT